ncbi:MAG: tRNA lysidine(34) synthetase TilS, partial [Anaerolineales bacterium]|nr:tRNA lysidine(34) synthetase TilS [Anaerolineales bacterium]
LRQVGYKIIVAHFNHRLRPESDADANLVKQTAARLAIPFVVDSGDVRAYAESESLSIEEAARNLRYRFLFEQARRTNAQSVAVAHTADDQVETVLMHFLRGAGLAGLKGMSHITHLPAFDANIPLVRPLLDVWREETVIYCVANGLRPYYDPSNDSINFLRNRLRHLLIPTLETYNPKFREAISRTSQSLTADHAFLTETVDAEWTECVVQHNPEYIIFDGEKLVTRSIGLRRNLVRRAISILRPSQDVNYAALERASTFISGPHGPTRVDLKGGLRLFREASHFIIATSKAGLDIHKWPQMPVDKPVLQIVIPAQVDLSGGWKFTSERWRLPALAKEQAEENQDQLQVWLDAETLPEPLELRTRRPGDRFEPLGMNGHSQKLSDFFVNEKLPQRARERWPLLCSGDTVVWVPGYRPAHPYRLRSATRSVMYFSLTRPLETSVD